MAGRTKDTFTNAICEQTVGKRKDIYDARVPGLRVSISPTGTAAFMYKFWDREQKKQVVMKIGTYVKGSFGVEQARAAVVELQMRSSASGRTPRAVAAPVAAAGAVSYARLVTMYIDYIKQPDPKKPWGGARVESWKQTESFLKGSVAAWGTMPARAITDDEIAALLREHIDAGSEVYANAIRMKLSTMFDWAKASGRKYVTSNPCELLGEEFHTRGKAKTRVLNAHEIKTLWNGLSDPQCPGDTMTKLSLKLILCTMLRPGEVCSIETSRIVDGTVTIPVEKVKNRSGDFTTPLSSLAVEVMIEALGDDKGRKYLFPSPTGKHIERASVSSQLSRRSTGATGRMGIIEYLNMQPFTPHDLRRTAATLAGELGVSDKVVAQCLNHTLVGGKEEQAPTVTGVYNHSAKRTILQAADPRIAALEQVANALREITGSQSPRVARPAKQIAKAA